MQPIFPTSKYDSIDTLMARLTIPSLERFDQPALDEAVKTQNYIEAIRLLKTLESPLDKVRALNECPDELPPFILLEKAFAILDCGPSVNELHRTVIPLVHLNAAIIHRDIAGCCMPVSIKNNMQARAAPILEASIQKLQAKILEQGILTNNALQLQAKAATLEHLLDLYEKTSSISSYQPPWLKAFLPDRLASADLWINYEAVSEVESSVQKVAAEIASSPLSLQGSTPINPIFLAAKRGDAGVITHVKSETNNSLLNTQDMHYALDSCDYTSVIKKLWGEPNQLHKLEWLRQESLKYTPFILSERAFAEFEDIPTLDTLFNISLPLLMLNSIILYGDAVCVEDASIPALIRAMREAEDAHLQELAEGQNLLEEGELLSIWSNQTSLQILVNQLAGYLENCSQSPPDWIKGFGTKGILQQDNDPEVSVKDSYSSIRIAVLQDLKSDIEEDLSKSSTP